jgi:hypothetical protein
MLFGYLTLFTALILSLSAAVYSILGLTAIFAAAFWPIVVLGGSLEIGKIITTLWLHKYWARAELQYKLYLCSAVIILMVLTSMGVFGFLSKAHLDQAVPSGDIQAQVQIFDDKIQTQKDNIKTARAALSQMDTAVDQTMGRSQDEKGADKAVAIRRSQARERTALQNDIGKAQTEITRLQEQRAPIASQARQVEAEVGPIKYIAALIYGDNPDTNILEKAVRWVIILIVIVFDPLALTLLLAATKTFEWEHEIDLFNLKKKKEDEQNQEDSTFTTVYNEDEPVFDRETNIPYETSQPTDVVEHKAAIDEPALEAEPIPEPITEPDHLAHIVVPEIDRNEDPLHHMAKVMWHAANPNDDHREHHALHQTGEIDRLPWQTDEHINSLAISDGEKKQLIARFASMPRPISTPEPAPTPELVTKFVEIDALKLKPDNVPSQTGEVKGFGTQFPAPANKGDMFIRVDRLPSVLYKFNGNMWIEVDKELTDSHAYDEAYIDHLISKIDSGEYDPDLLSDTERESIERRLNNNTRGI